MKSSTGVVKINTETAVTSSTPVPTRVCFSNLMTGLTYAHRSQVSCRGTFDRLKLAAAIGTPRTAKVANQSPPRRKKKDPGPSSAHEYSVDSFRDEYSFTYESTRCLVGGTHSKKIDLHFYVIVVILV